MKTVTLILGVVIAASIVGTAAGAAPKHATKEVTRLSREVRTLRHELRNMTRARNAATAALIKKQAQNAVLQSEISQAQGQAAALQAKLDAIPTPLAVAVEQVRREVSWADGGAATPSGQLVAEAAMDYVVGHVSLAAYGYLEDHGLTAPGWPTSDVNYTLSVQAGYCGHAAEAFKAIVEHFGYQVIGVWFTYNDPGGTPDGHTAAEVYYQGGWHFFDPTFGQFWTDSSGNVLPIDAVRAGQGTRQKDVASFFNLVDTTLYSWPAGDDTWFETDPATTVAVGGQYLP